jgi:hypothetical protein
MAIDAEKITSDITLELAEDEISIADFGKAFENFVGLVKEISREVASEKSAAAWTIKVYPGSAGLGLSPADQQLTPMDVNTIRNVLVEGLEVLSKGIRPTRFSDKAIECSKNLASLFKGKGTEPSIRIWSKKERSLPITREIAKRADELLAVAYEEDGAVDGILERVDAHKRLHFVVYDVIDDRSIKVEITEAQLEQALKVFNQRVEVVGLVRYRKDGMPVSVKAARIIEYPSASEIPSLEQMRSLLAGH